MPHDPGRLPPRVSAPAVLDPSTAHHDRSPAVQRLQRAVDDGGPRAAEPRILRPLVASALSEVAETNVETRARRAHAVLVALQPLRPEQIRRACGTALLQVLNGNCEEHLKEVSTDIQQHTPVDAQRLALVHAIVDLQRTMAERVDQTDKIPLVQDELLQVSEHATTVAEHRRRYPDAIVPGRRVQSQALSRGGVLAATEGGHGSASAVSGLGRAGGRSAASLRTSTAAVPTLPWRQGRRHLLPAREQRQQFQHVFSELTCGSASYTVSARVDRGTFGKFKLARSLDEVGATLVAVKEFRTVRKPGRDSNGAGKTLSVAQDRAFEEIELTAWLRDTLETFDEEHEQLRTLLGIDPTGSNTGMVSGREPCVVLGQTLDETSGKIYMVSTLAAMSAELLAADMPDEMRPAMGASFAAQTFLELHLLHERAGVAHVDLKLANVFANHHGEFKLADFGMVSNLRANGELEDSNPRGSHPAPEMLAQFGPLGKPAPLTAAVDVYALTVACLELVGGVASPIAFAVHGEDAGERRGQVDTEATRARVRGMTDFIDALPRGDDNQPRLPRTAAGTVDLAALPQTELPALRAWIATAASRAPALTDALLAGLQGRASDRPEPLALAQAAARCFAGTEEAHRALSREVFDDAVAYQESTYGEILDKMNAYERIVYNG